MPQYDRHRSLVIPIEFNATEDLSGLPYSDHISLVLITSGKAVVSINSKTIVCTAPCVLCLSECDKFEIIANVGLYAQSFSLNPSYLKNRKSYRVIKNNEKYSGTESSPDLLHLFYHRDSHYNGILNVQPYAYFKIFEWMAVIGTEIQAQSDSRWTCRIRAYFLRIINILDDIYDNYKNTDTFPYTSSSNAYMLFDYLHTHYMDEISLDELCRMMNTNRTTLNKKFKEITGQTVINYLLNYRLRIAKELLAHTGLSIDEIARASGFKYDTYLIRQFKRKMGQTPTEYRQEARRKYKIVVDNVQDSL
mgnify:FL=1